MEQLQKEVEEQNNTSGEQISAINDLYTRLVNAEADRDKLKT